MSYIIGFFVAIVLFVALVILLMRQSYVHHIALTAGEDDTKLSKKILLFSSTYLF